MYEDGSLPIESLKALPQPQTHCVFVTAEELSKLLNRVAPVNFDKPVIYSAPAHWDVNAKSRSDLR